MKRFLIALSLIGLSSSAGVAFAADVPASLIVVRGGAEFAWAAPCAPEDPSCGSVPLVMHDGWHIATMPEFAAGFAGLEDLWGAFDGGAKCASAFFSSGYSHCDGVNVWPPDSGYVLTVWNAPVDGLWSDNAGNMSFSETFVARAVHPIPEPETYAMLLAGLGLLGFVARRRQRKLAAA